MLALRENCIHPTTKKPYILESSGGRDNSPEGHQVVEPPFPTSPDTPSFHSLNYGKMSISRGRLWLIVIWEQ
jgi:hypothetical protein